MLVSNYKSLKIVTDNGKVIDCQLILKMMLRCKTKTKSLDVSYFMVYILCSFSLQAKFIPTCSLNCFTQLLVFYTHCWYGTDGETLIFFIINGTTH